MEAVIYRDLSTVNGLTEVPRGAVGWHNEASRISKAYTYITNALINPQLCRLAQMGRSSYLYMNR